MLTSARSSVSAGMSGSLPASSRCMSGWFESSAIISSDGTGSTPRTSGSTVVASDGSGSRSSGSTACSVSNRRAGSACSSASGSFSTERRLPSKAYGWSYGWGHTWSCENESSSTWGNSSTGSPSGEAPFSTRGITKARVRVAFSMSINCREVRREQASAAGFSRPGMYHNVRLYSSRNWDHCACPGVSGRGHVLRYQRLSWSVCTCTCCGPRSR